jgi:hypothetical protein
MDLYSDKNLDGDTIAKLVPVNILLSKSTFTESSGLNQTYFIKEHQIIRPIKYLQLAHIFLIFVKLY